MEKTIHLKNENVRILIDTEETITSVHNISTVGAIAKCLKGIYRYQEFTMTKDIMARILFLALKGESCKSDHLSISQRISLYEYFKDKDVEDPYIKQFMKETKEKHKHAII